MQKKQKWCERYMRGRKRSNRGLQTSKKNADKINRGVERQEVQKEKYRKRHKRCRKKQDMYITKFKV